MRRTLLCTILVLGGLSLAYAATETQVTITGTLEQLGLENKTPANTPPGGPATFAVTMQTIKKMRQMIKKGEGFEIDAAGKMKVVKLKDAEPAEEKKETVPEEKKETVPEVKKDSAPEVKKEAGEAPKTTAPEKK